MKPFADIPEVFSKQDTANIVLIPVCYDGTSTWQKGAEKGPDAFFEAARNMELYDIETGKEAYENGIFVPKALTGYHSPEEMVAEVYYTTRGYLMENKFTTLLGGEHSISIGAIRAVREKYSDVSILQLDAHTDLRTDYMGTPYNHACAMHEASQTCNLVQVGIRSMDVAELPYLQKGNVFYAEDIYNNDNWFSKSIEKLTDTVYISIDLDVFDPSIMPSTGTPEPGGLTWYVIVNFLKKVFKEKNVIGFDIVELCPNATNKAPDFLAAKLYYKLLLPVVKFRVCVWYVSHDGMVLGF